MKTHQSNQTFELHVGPTEHIKRTKEIAKNHPGVKRLFGANPWSLVLLTVLSLIQLGIGLTLNHQPLWVVLTVAYFIGTSISLAIMVLVHDASHNLVAKSKYGNYLAMFIANFGTVWPLGFFYKNYHLKHHIFIGQYGTDVDMPTKWEALIAGRSWWRKLFWLIFFPFFYVVPRMLVEKKPKLRIVTLFSVLVQVLVFIRMRRWGLEYCLIYMAISPFFMLTLCPAMGSRGILEHLVFKEGQETYSYYGPYNYITLNNGYHSEHHDFPNIPWNRLPKLHNLANEYYKDRYIISSYYYAIKRFLFDPNISLFSRIERKGETPSMAKGKR